MKKGVSKQSAFLAAFEATASVTKAAKAAKIERQLHYRWLKDDEAYPALFAEALERAGQTLEDEAVRRAYEGVDEPVVYKGELCYQTTSTKNKETGEWITKRSNKPLVMRKYSDTLLLALLKAAKPAKYRDNLKAEVTGTVDIVGLLAAARARLRRDDDES